MWKTRILSWNRCFLLPFLFLFDSLFLILMRLFIHRVFCRAFVTTFLLCFVHVV